jgi:hypothetical protein
MSTPALPSRSAGATLDFRTLQFLAEAVQLLESRPFQNRMHFFVYRKLLDELRVAVAQPGARRNAERLAAVRPAIAEALEEFSIDADLCRRATKCPELDRLMRRLAGGRVN